MLPLTSALPRQPTQPPQASLKFDRNEQPHAAAVGVPLRTVSAELHCEAVPSAKTLTVVHAAVVRQADGTQAEHSAREGTVEASRSQGEGCANHSATQADDVSLRLQRMEEQLAQALEAQRQSELKAQALSEDLQKVAAERNDLKTTLEEVCQ